MWDLPGPGLKPVSPALAGTFSTTAPPGKPWKTFLNFFFFFFFTMHEGLSVLSFDFVNYTPLDISGGWHSSIHKAVLWPSPQKLPPQLLCSWWARPTVHSLPRVADLGVHPLSSKQANWDHHLMQNILPSRNPQILSCPFFFLSFFFFLIHINHLWLEL